MEHTINLSAIKKANRLDAEFFNPKLLNLHTQNTPLLSLCQFIRTGPPGNLVPTSSYTPSGIKLYKPSNLNNWTCENGKITHISPAHLKQKKLIPSLPGDILISRVGDIKFGIIQNGNSTISPNLIILRTKKELLDPYFLLALLNQKDINSQLQKSSKRVSLASITTHHLSQLLIPTTPLATQKQISNHIKDALSKQQQAKALYSEAEALLLSTLKFNPSQPTQKTTEINLSEILPTQRLDAEFHLLKQSLPPQIKTTTLDQLAKISRGIEPGTNQYQPNGKLFLRASNIDKFGLINKSQKFISPTLYQKLSKKYQPNMGDILLVKDGKPGIGCLLTHAPQAIISESIVRLTPQSLSPEYLFLCLNSPFCQQQISLNKDGSLQPHLKIDKIKNLQIPIIPKNLQNQISSLIKKSYTKINQSKQTLQKIKI